MGQQLNVKKVNRPANNRIENQSKLTVNIEKAKAINKVQKDSPKPHIRQSQNLHLKTCGNELTKD